MNKPLVSVVIPTFNRADLIEETLVSIQNQDFENWECIIVDDGSTDQTAEIIANFIAGDQRFCYFERPQNREKGANACRNIGFEKSKGLYLNWIDSDDVITTDHLSKHLNTHLKRSNIDVSVSNALTFSGSKENIIRKWSTITPEKNLIDEMIKGKTLWPIGSVFWKKDAVIILPFEENIVSSQEWTFHLKQLILKEINYVLLDDSTYLVREHLERIGKSKSKSKYYATFYSRFYIFKLLKEKNLVTKTNEKDLLDIMFMSFYLMITQKYYSLLFDNYLKILRSLFGFKNWVGILKVLFITIPFYILFKKGYSYFKV